MNIKIGQILKGEGFVKNRKVLEVLPNVVILDFLDYAGIPCKQIYTYAEIEEHFELPKEEWEPKKEERYWYINNEGYIYSSIWENDSVDYERINFLGIYQTQELAEQAKEKILKAIKGIE